MFSVASLCKRRYLKSRSDFLVSATFTSIARATSRENVSGVESIYLYPNLRTLTILKVNDGVKTDVF